MPELPEVESARSVIEHAALGRVIGDVDDSDTYECRPHQPGEIRAALLGRRLTVAHRRGKSIWCDTSGVVPARTPGPALGLHLGMSGKIVITDGRGDEIEGGDYWGRGRASGDYRFSRFSLIFADGGSLLLVDPRRARPGSPRSASRGSRPRCARDHPVAIPGRVRARDRAGESTAARSGRDRWHRQPAGRSGPLAGEDQPGPTGQRTCPGRR